MNKHKVDTTLILKRVYDVPVASVWEAWTNLNEHGATPAIPFGKAPPPSIRNEEESP
jgi:hypothetical protein